MTDQRYRRNADCVFSLKYHLVWCPKYRMPILVGTVAKELRALLTQKARDLGVTIETLEIMPDHVHLFVSADPTDAPQRLANQFKGFTSRMLRQKYAHLRSRLPTLWSRSYYVGSVGQVSEKTVKHYIESQKGRS
ncbi:MAG: IS200/IS605 family transposase [Chloroflexi bacterium]|nr:IS200/IS605 family transposase [Chloroflexota bacterium]